MQMDPDDEETRASPSHVTTKRKRARCHAYRERMKLKGLQIQLLQLLKLESATSDIEHVIEQVLVKLSATMNVQTCQSGNQLS